MARYLLKILKSYKREKRQRSFKVRLFRFVSLSIILALLISSLNFIFYKKQPKAHAQTFTTSGTWTVPAGVNYATFESWGGGGTGAGSSTNGTGGGGGAGGQYAKKTVAVNVGDVYTVTVGGTTAGGTGSGSAGHDTQVTNPSSTVVVLAKGGAGGTAGGAGGAGSTTNGIGDTIYAGGNGAAGSGASATAGAGGGGAGSNGNGGNASGTTAGTGTATSGGNGGGIGSNATGGSGSNYGGGGGGATKTSGGGKSGGTGAQGLVVATGITVAPPKIRQEINIIDATLATSSTSGGMVQLDTTRYGGTVSYYFEVVTANSSGSTDTVTLTRSGTSTNDASISLAGTGANTRVRSSAFTPPSNTQTFYVVKTGASHSIKSARIIVLQAQTPLLSTETQIEIGNQETGLTNTTETPLTSPKYWHYDSSKWNNSPAFFAEATASISSTGTSLSIVLQEDNGSFAGWTNVGNSIIAVFNSNTSVNLFRNAFTPANGRNYRIAAFESSGARNYSIYNAKIVVDQGPWSQTGNTLSSISSGSAAIAELSSTRIALIDDLNDQLRTYDFNGTNWSQTGSSLTITGSFVPAIAALSASRIAYIDSTNDLLQTYDFNGSTWSQTGSSLTITNNLGPAITDLTSSRVALSDFGNNKLTAYDFNGSTWSQTGTALSLQAGTGGGALATLSSSRIAKTGDGTNLIKAYDFNGTSWSLTGNTFNTNGGTSEMTALSSSRVAAVFLQQIGSTGQNSINSVHVLDFDGTNWSYTGATTNVSNGGTLAALSGTRIALLASGSLETLDYNTNPTTLLEPQYLLQNTVASVTGLQGYPTLWDSSEVNALSSSYTNVIDSTNASSSAKLQDIDNANTDVTNSTATGNNQVFSSAMTMPTSGHQFDSNIIANATTVTADRIDVALTLDGSGQSLSNSSPGAPSLTSPSNGGTTATTTPQLQLSATDSDNDTVMYKILLYNTSATSGGNCSGSLLTTVDQTSSGTGWDNGTTAYSSGATATYTVQSALTNGNNYCWQAQAIDPSGSNTFGTISTPSTFTVSTAPSTDVLMRGGTYFNNGTKQPIYWAQ